MSKNEIDQRNENRLVIPCNCGSYHFLVLEYYVDDTSKDFNVSMVDEPAPLWYRIKNAWRHIRYGSSIYWIDTGVTEKDLDNIIELINKYKGEK